jgi:hypothetical protein
MSSRLTFMLAGAFAAMVLLIMLKVGVLELMTVAAVIAVLFFVLKGPRRGGPGQTPGPPR